MESITTVRLLESMAEVGLPLWPADPGAGNLYIWTSKRGAPVYIGKSTDVRGRRVKNESGWIAGFGRATLVDSTRSVIATILAVHEAQVEELCWDPSKIDLVKMQEAYRSSGLSGEPTQKIEALFAEDPPWAISVDHMEKLLIRATLHTGTLIANSQHATQWEGPVGNETDTLGRLVAIRSGHLDERFRW